MAGLWCCSQCDVIHRLSIALGGYAWRYTWSLCLWLLVLTCRHDRCLWASVCGFMVKLICHFSPYWPWFMTLLTRELTVLRIFPYSSLSLRIDFCHFLFWWWQQSCPSPPHHNVSCVSSASCLRQQAVLYHQAFLVAWLTVYLVADCRATTLLFLNPSSLSLLVCVSLLFLSSFDGRANKTTRLVIGPKYGELRDWHHGVSARTLNVQ